ncbi:MAG: cysteine hydrolase [Oscillospiraceae bacterium]|nr:cysteine hydrolase [Oscillospiraceae bacterium]
MKKYLIVVDMQHDFVDGALGTAEAAAILESVKAKIAQASAEGKTVIFTQDTHGEDYMQTSEGRHLPVPHCLKGTWGWRVMEELDVAEALHIHKPSFGYTGWADIVKKPESIELIGVCTDICVVSNALILKALYPEVPMRVDAACCAGTTPANHLAALNTMQCCQIEVVGA